MIELSYIIDPKKFKINEDSRLEVYDQNDNFYKTIEINAGKTYTVNDEHIFKNIDKYKFMYKVFKEEWIPASKKFLFIKKYDFQDYLTDNKIMNETDIYNNIIYYNNLDEDRYNTLRIIFRKTCEDLWLNHNSIHKNLSKYLIYIKKTEIEFNDVLNNLNQYLRFSYRLKKNYRKLGINRNFYNEIKPMFTKDNQLTRFIKSEINILKREDLQLNKILIGQYYSLLGNRELAVEFFNKAVEYNNNLEKDFNVGQGASTFNLLSNVSGTFENEINFSQEYTPDDRKSLLFSVDSRYLRLYGPSIFLNIMALQNYHFHFHVVGYEIDELIDVIQESEVLFKDLIKYSKKNSNTKGPTFSYEIIPERIESYKTYSACARFINASYFMEYFDSDLLILDADMFLTDTLVSFFKQVEKADVAIAFSRGTTPVVPWRRVMAGNIYLKNNNKAKQFIDLAKEYILENLHHKNSWTLDQNALSFAYDKVMESDTSTSFINMYNIKRPMSHPAIRKYIELD